jgi:hypothetical protein
VKGLLTVLPRKSQGAASPFSRDFAVVAAQKPARRRIAFSILLAVSVKLHH